MRFATRTFLMSFLPFALLLGGSFWAIHKLVDARVREGLRNSLRDADVSMSEVRKKSEIQNNRFLRIVGENPSLKAGLQLLLQERRNTAARLTVEDQLREICETLKFDYLLVSDPDGRLLAGVYREGEALPAMDIERMKPPTEGIFEFGKVTTFQVTSIPINQGEENIGRLSVGEKFDIRDFTTLAVLLRGSKVLKSNLPAPISAAELEAALAGCTNQPECEVRLQGETYITLPTDSIRFGDDTVLRTLQNVDSATGPVQRILGRVFTVAGLAFLFAALIVSAISSRTIVQPLAEVVATLQQSEQTGLLPEFQFKRSTVLEVRDLERSSTAPRRRSRRRVKSCNALTWSLSAPWPARWTLVITTPPVTAAA